MQKDYVEVVMHSCLGVLNQKENKDLFWDKYSSEKTEYDNGICQNVDTTEEPFNLKFNWFQP